VILLVAGGREHSMRAYDWMRLDAIHIESAIAGPVAAVLQDHRDFYGGELPPEEFKRLRGYRGPVTALYEGEADGADICARAWAESRGIPVRPHPYKSELGRAGGPARNAEMLAAAIDEATTVGEPLAIVLFPGGPGTADMAARAAKLRDDFPLIVRVLDYRGGPAQRWTAEDVLAAEDAAEGIICGGDPPSYAWPKAIAARWIARGGAGMPLVSAHLFTDHGRVQLPPAGVLYIGRSDYRHNIPESLLANPFKKADGVDVQVLLERYRSHLRGVYKRLPAVRDLLHSLTPWTLLVCWCHADRPCHGCVVADAAMQVQAAAELATAGRELPAPHWSAYRGRRG